MKHEIIELHDVQIIGMAKKIAFNKAKEECPKFWGEYVEKIIKPVFIEKRRLMPFSRPPSTMVLASSDYAPAIFLITIVLPVGKLISVLAAKTPLLTSLVVYIKVVKFPLECSSSPFIAESG